MKWRPGLQHLGTSLFFRTPNIFQQGYGWVSFDHFDSCKNLCDRIGRCLAWLEFRRECHFSKDKSSTPEELVRSLEPKTFWHFFCKCHLKSHPWSLKADAQEHGRIGEWNFLQDLPWIYSTSYLLKYFNLSCSEGGPDSLWTLCGANHPLQPGRRCRIHHFFESWPRAGTGVHGGSWGRALGRSRGEADHWLTIFSGWLESTWISFSHRWKYFPARNHGGSCEVEWGWGRWTAHIPVVPGTRRGGSFEKRKWL